MNIYIETFGCSANQNNGEIMAGMLERVGHIIVQNEKNSDINILNSCIVKGPTLQKMLSRIKELSNKKLIVAGCMPDVFSKQILKIAPKAALLGSHHINEIVKVVKSLLEGVQVQFISKQKETHLCKPKNYKNRIIGITQISEGCLGDCSFCVVKLVKGQLNSYPQDEIIKNIQNDLDSGCKEIWLTSQDCAAYGLDVPQKRIFLPELLSSILKLKGKFQVRLGMSNPNHILPIAKDLIECYKNQKMFKFLHIPLQSGSDNVLKAMNRHYNSKDFAEIIQLLKNEVPGITISTDIIVGYPTETEQDFEDTIKILEQTRPDIINIARFWSMPKTKASALPELSKKVVMERTQKLMALHNKIALENNSKWIGWIGKVLVDEHNFNNVFTARNSSYKHILLQSNEKLLGKTVDVKITKADSHHLFGALIVRAGTAPSISEAP
jgi:MiaB-like tRNA modifying enzyme